MANYYNDTTPHIGAPYTGANTATTSGTIPQSLVLKSWAKKAWEAGIKESYFSKFMGRDAKSIIHIKEELSRGRGTSINIPLLMPLAGAGVIEDKIKNELTCVILCAKVITLNIHKARGAQAPRLPQILFLLSNFTLEEKWNILTSTIKASSVSQHYIPTIARVAEMDGTDIPHSHTLFVLC